jgi:hypothetical protein
MDHDDETIFGFAHRGGQETDRRSGPSTLMVNRQKRNSGDTDGIGVVNSAISKEITHPTLLKKAMTG